MIDVVRLLKNQEMFEIQRAREENREPRVYHGVFSSHPDNDTRLKEVVASAGKVARGEQRPDNRDVYLSRITGLPVGASEAQGVTRGTRFYHADMGFTVAFPTGWHRAEPARQAGRRDTAEGRDAATVRDALSAGHDPRAVPGAESQGHANRARRAARGQRAARVHGDCAERVASLG